MIKAIIYDMDDLMVDSEPMHVKAWEILLKESGHSLCELPEDTRARLIGIRVKDVCRLLIDAFHIDTDLDSFYMKKNGIFLDICRHELKAMPGLKDSLEFFRANGYKIAIGSSANMQYIDLVLGKFSIRGYFDVIVSGDGVSKGKPHPETYLIAAEKLGYKPEECVVLEDAENGIRSAISAGCRCIAIRNLNTPPQVLSSADLVLDSLEKLTADIAFANCINTRYRPVDDTSLPKA